MGSPGHHQQKSREARGKGHDAGSGSRAVATHAGCLRTRRLRAVCERGHGRAGAASLQPPRKPNARATRRRKAQPGETLWCCFYPESQNFNPVFLARKAHAPVGQDQATLAGTWGFCPQEGTQPGPSQRPWEEISSTALARPQEQHLGSLT